MFIFVNTLNFDQLRKVGKHWGDDCFTFCPPLFPPCSAPGLPMSDDNADYFVDFSSVLPQAAVICGRGSCPVKTFPPGTEMFYLHSKEPEKPGRQVCSSCYSYYRGHTTTEKRTSEYLLLNSIPIILMQHRGYNRWSYQRRKICHRHRTQQETSSQAGCKSTAWR